MDDASIDDYLLELDEFDDSYTDKDYNPLKDKGYSSDDEPMDHSYSRPIRTRARDYADTMPGPSSRTPASASLPGSSSHTPATPELMCDLFNLFLLCSLLEL
ncbi:uncharacterized protein LOC120352528 [Nilaparvata lugens]|uniref:uncharacterized protein LOC120352528 n=1 Tax=Nilaparvata lugens TaxID=108931 RepID=UPI00193CDD1D|nr:uncharacterized protein LOC120352528 [Nilaparvata lugens]